VGNRPGSDFPEGPQGIRPPGGYAGSVSVPQQQGPGGPGAGPQGRISGPLNSGRPLGPINRAGSPGGPPTATWSAAPGDDQGRFDAFRPDAEAATAAPASDDKADPPPKERNGRVLAIVLGTAVMLLVIPLAVVYLFTRSSGDGFNPAVGACVRQSGNTAEAATCGEPGAFEVVSRVDDAANCPDKGQPIVEISGGRADNVLCLSPKAAAPPAGAGNSSSPSAEPTT
jgi:integrin beta 8